MGSEKKVHPQVREKRKIRAFRGASTTFSLQKETASGESGHQQPKSRVKLKGEKWGKGSGKRWATFGTVSGIDLLRT